MLHLRRSTQTSCRLASCDRFNRAEGWFDNWFFFFFRLRSCMLETLQSSITSSSSRSAHQASPSRQITFNRWLADRLSLSMWQRFFRSSSEWENATDTPARETLPTPQQLYKHGLEHLNISIDYWQRALTIIELSLANQADDRANENALLDLKQKVQFLLNKIDVTASAHELAFILQQEQATASTAASVPLSSNTFDTTLTALNRQESNRVQQELQTALSVQSDLNTFNDRRSLRSIRSTDSFQSCPDVRRTKKRITLFFSRAILF